MKFHFSTGEQFLFLQAIVDEAQIHGHGGGLSPILSLYVQLHASHKALQPESGLEILWLDARLSTNHTLLGRSGISPINVILQKNFDTLHEHSSYFEFPLSPTQFQAIEQWRTDAGVKFRLDFQLVYRKLRSLTGPPPNSMSQTVWGYIQTVHTTTSDEFTIPRDVWLTRVLPNVGFGTVHVLEFPAASVESCQTLDHSFKALKQAEEQHKLGFYDEAAAKCRTAIEPFFEYEPVDPTHPESRKVPVVRKSWEAKLGKATYEWLKGTLGSIKTASNVSHHSPNAHFSQLDSQMILGVTTSVVAYIARSLKPEDLK